MTGFRFGRERRWPGYGPEDLPVGRDHALWLRCRPAKPDLRFRGCRGANASSASSYEVSEEGDLAVISGAVPTKQTAACWLITSRDGRFIYTANAGSGSISGYRVDHDGCDLILCWVHNWPECPISLEVIELSKEIKRLATSDE
jgi:hypothetical protein